MTDASNSQTVQPHYPEIVRGAGERYRSAMTAVAASNAGTVAKAAGIVADVLDRALARGPELSPREVAFHQSVFADLQVREYDHFVHQWTTGLGSDVAPVLVVGTEVADTWTEPQDVAYHVGLAVEALCWGRLDVMKRMMEGTVWTKDLDWSIERRPFTVHPYDLFPPKRQGQHTWAVLARIVAPDPSNWRDLVWNRAAQPALGDLTYEIERSAFPSKRQMGGRQPTSDRMRWMADDVVPWLRKTAKVLLLHGGGGRWSQAWETVDVPLIQAFLGTASNPWPDFVWESIDMADLGHLETDGRLVVSSRGLSGAISGTYVARVRQLIGPYLVS